VGLSGDSRPTPHRIRDGPVSTTVDTRCEHCSEPMTLEVDHEMKVRVATPGAGPMVFTPDVATWDPETPSIIDAF
jgi:hypothetical protein